MLPGTYSQLLKYRIMKRRELFMDHRQKSESLFIMGLLTFSGGFQDAYSYYQRGKVFSFAQTGNTLFMAWNFITGNFGQAANYAIPLFFFLIGICTAQFIRIRIHAGQRFHWRQMVLAIQILSLFFTALIANDRMANLCMAFAGALQFHAFRKVKGLGMTSLACTGNYRAMAESFVLWIETRKRAYLIRAGIYLLILALFFFGVCFGVLVQYGMGRYTIWIGCGILLFALLWMSF